MTTKTEQHEFQTEAKELLNLMIHSIYTNKDIFLRELISNASDALDKLRFEAIEKPDILDEKELCVWLYTDIKNRTLTIQDNGIGMNKDELIKNIGTIAKSGTREFMDILQKQKDSKNPDLIGQFGVGFYASFMVADKVEIITSRAGEENTWRWESSGDGKYILEESNKNEKGTSIILHLKPVDEENNMKDYTEQWVLKDIITKYSDFVSYPIKMSWETKEYPNQSDDTPSNVPPKITIENKTLNSMKAIWTRNSKDVSEEEYKEFYKHISHDWNEPLSRITTSIEGTFEAKALLFLPQKAPMDLYFRDMSHRGIQLYTKRVFIMDECKELMPECLRFVKGVVDSESLSLNVSRETLQQDRQIKAIKKHLVKKVFDHLKTMKSKEKEKYLGFWKEFGPVLKEGLVSWQKEESVLDLMLVQSTNKKEELVSLSEYVDRMPESQKEIFYLTTSKIETAKRSPHLESFIDKGIEVLLLVDNVDEVWLQYAPEYKGKKFKSIGQGEVVLGTEEEQRLDEEKLEKKKEEFQDIIPSIRVALQDEVKEVRLSNRLTSSAACLVTEEGDMTPQMELLMRQNGREAPKTKRILELNPNHALFSKLEKISQKKDTDSIKNYAQVLYGQAILAEGGQLQDPAEFASLLTEIMEKSIDVSNIENENSKN